MGLGVTGAKDGQLSSLVRVCDGFSARSTFFLAEYTPFWKVYTISVYFKLKTVFFNRVIHCTHSMLDGFMYVGGDADTRVTIVTATEDDKMTI